EIAVERSHAFARIDQEQRHIRLFHRLFGLGAHARGQIAGLGALETGGVGDAKFEIGDSRGRLAAVAGQARFARDQRGFAPGETVEQGRFADIGPSDDRDLERHEAAISLYRSAIRSASSVRTKSVLPATTGEMKTLSGKSA